MKEITKKGVSCTHRATRKRLVKCGVAKGEKPLHHWAISEHGRLGKQLPQWFVNHPWNYKNLASRELHFAVEGRGGWNLARYERWWLGTPDWYKLGLASYGGRATAKTGTWVQEFCLDDNQ